MCMTPHTPCRLRTATIRISPCSPIDSTSIAPRNRTTSSVEDPDTMLTGPGYDTVTHLPSSGALFTLSPVHYADGCYSHHASSHAADSCCIGSRIAGATQWYCVRSYARACGPMRRLQGIRQHSPLPAPPAALCSLRAVHDLFSSH